MWCPFCNCDSPHVVLLHSGIVCSRCETEVLAERPSGKSVPPAAGGSRWKGDQSLSPISPAMAGKPVYRFDVAHPLTGNAEPAKSGPAPRTTVPRSASNTAGNPRAATKTVGKKGVRPPGGPPETGHRPDLSPGGESEPDAARRLPGIAGPLLVFFAGQFTIAWAWVVSGFPAFAAGTLVTLFGAGWMLRSVQRAVGGADRTPTEHSVLQRRPLQKAESPRRQTSDR